VSTKVSEPGKKPFKKRLKKWLMLNLGPSLTWAYTQFAGRTSRWIIINGENILAMFQKGEPYIAALWHNRALMMPFIFQTHGGKNVVVMVSASEDGIFTQRVLRRFGYSSAVGSSTRGGKEAFQEMIKAYKKQQVAMAITPDGPRGPSELVKPGVVLLAKETGLPIVLVSYYAKKVKRLKSWDRFVIVWPFNTIAAIGSKEHIYVPSNATNEEIESYCKKVEDEMKRISNFVEDYFAGKVTLEGQSYFYSRVSFFWRGSKWSRPDGTVFTAEDMVKEESKHVP